MNIDDVKKILITFPLEKLPTTPNDLKFIFSFMRVADGFPQFKSLVEAIEKVSEINLHEGSMLNLGSTQVRFDKNTLAYWLLWRSAVNSVDQAIQELSYYFSITWNPVLEVLAISGLDTSKKLNIYDDINLVPIESLPFSSYKVFFELEKSVPTFISFKESFFRVAIIRETKLSPQFVNESDDKKIFNADQYDLFDICLCFSLIQDFCPVPGLKWYQLLDNVPCAQFVGSGGSSEINDISDGPNFKISKTYIDEVREIIDVFMRLKPEDKEFYRLIIRRLSQAKRRKSQPDKILDIAIALETLLLDDKDDKQQLGLTFRLRGAWYLAKNFEERKKYYDLLKYLYDLRSNVAHEGKIKEKVHTKYGTVDAFLKNIIEITQKLIIKIMKEGSPNTQGWTEIVLGIR